ncbi:hypothetical protein IPT12_15360 [Xanthomonas perforans]|uniref:Uncharacterized protein n=1 Tax=Xanthomonas perforans TaxID=442694 RepID=A0A6L9VVG1_XANPE|nr:hypothetical protein [Xanthomonas perforans]MBZ2413815.1 hypothetical protein [Xanthomonas perforans]MBZ2422208.1 hypothetical protein [Xanthomonas perforans]MBZ2426333.1 hypothetical protein [Xanthomonas perforans]MBZ2430788.1 hypothetical protein [Xanthomonas perforans]MBZ2451503.1 hypothetical protein [Xanthomonas perforans]
MGSADANEDESLATGQGGVTGDALNALRTQMTVDQLEQMSSQLHAGQQTLIDMQKDARGRIESLTYEAFGELIFTIDVTQGLIADVFRRLDRHRWSSEGDTLKRHLLLASFASNMYLVRTITIQGLYLSAATLIRQQMECVTDLDSIEKGKPRRKGKPANVAVLRWKLARAYGSLSDIAHNNSDKLFQLLAEEHAAAPEVDPAAPADETDRPFFNIRVSPRFIDWKAKQLLSQQACYALITAAHALCFMQDVTDEVVTDEDAAFIQIIGRSLELQEIVRPAG